MTSPNAIAVVQEQVSNEQPTMPASTVEMGVAHSLGVEMDEFGRDASERTVELSPRDAESIDHEVASGKHQTYDDALAFVIARGLAEIKRTRDAAMKLAQAKLLSTKKESWKTILSQNPALAIDPKIVATMLADLGLTPKA
jgi:hypothetical protein